LDRFDFRGNIFRQCDGTDRAAGDDEFRMKAPT
jgi:hypothetical protein